MASRGFLIRFIDIGLIVLFGFLMISEIESSSRVEMGMNAEAEEAAEEPPDERAFVTVGITEDGLMSVVDPRSGEVLMDGLASGQDLERVLRQLDRVNADAERETVVLIEPHEDSPVQFTVDVMDVCDRLSLARSLQVEVGSVGPGLSVATLR